jgi:hypothetical protein
MKAIKYLFLIAFISQCTSPGHESIKSKALPLLDSTDYHLDVTHNISEALRFAQEGKRLTDNYSHLDSAGYYYYVFVGRAASAYIIDNNESMAAREYQTAIRNVSRFKDPVSLADVYRAYAQLGDKSVSYGVMLENFISAGEIYQRNNERTSDAELAVDTGLLLWEVLDPKAQDEYQSAIAYIDTALNDESDQVKRAELKALKVRAQSNLALMLAESGDVSNAKTEIEKAIAGNAEIPGETYNRLPDNTLKVNQAFVFYKLKDAAGMKATLDEVKSEKNIDYVNGCYFKLIGQFEEAYAYFQKAYKHANERHSLRGQYYSNEEINSIALELDTKKMNSNQLDSLKFYQSNLSKLKTIRDSNLTAFNKYKGKLEVLEHARIEGILKEAKNNWSLPQWATFASGAVFMLLLFAVAVFVRKPLPAFNMLILRIIIAIAGAMFTFGLTGSLNIEIGKHGLFYIQAGGALAVLVLLYKWNPPGLRQKRKTKPRAKVKAADKITQ